MANDQSLASVPCSSTASDVLPEVAEASVPMEASEVTVGEHETTTWSKAASMMKFSSIGKSWKNFSSRPDGDDSLSAFGKSLKNLSSRPDGDDSLSAFGKSLKNFSGRSDGDDSLSAFGKSLKNFSSRPDGDDSYRFGDISRGLVKDAMMPMMREKVHQMKMSACDVKDKYSYHGMIKKAAESFEVDGDFETSAKGHQNDARRWWTTCCQAAHQPHDPAEDAPEPPQRQRRSQTTDYEMRGCLEVEVRAFSGVSTGNAGAPICQLAFENRWTGALWPCDLSGVDERAEKPHAARFALEEIAGCDLRIHVFDSGSIKFKGGLEDSAFCGGALVPLAAIQRRCRYSDCFSLDAFKSQILETSLAVKLLPLDMLKGKHKYELPKRSPSGPQPELGHVMLKIKLTLFDMSCLQLYAAVPFLGQPPLAAQATVSVADDPMTVLNATFNAIQRVKSALDFSSSLITLAKLREEVITCVVLQALWAFASLAAQPWMWPACAGMVSVILVWCLSSDAEIARRTNPVRLYDEEQESKTMTERGKHGLTQALKAELGLVTFVKNATELASTFERIKFVLTLRDPHLSLLIGGMSFALILFLTVALWLFLLAFGQVGLRVLAWLVGCISLLPELGRAMSWRVYLWAKKEKERVLGPSKIRTILYSLWQRIPDSVEANHLDLFDANVYLQP